jgi:toxin ParE1/3/4
MAEFKLTNKAVDDLSQIWNYTFDTWSENQADKYYEMLISACVEIAANPTRGKGYEGISESLLGMKSNRHIIFYRILNGSLIEITRILHESMDLKMRIEE